MDEGSINNNQINEMKFSEKLFKERKKIGLTQNQMADYLEVKHRTYWGWERAEGKKEPDLVTQEGCLARIKASPKS